MAGLAQLVRALLERLTALDSLSWTKTQGHDITLETKVMRWGLGRPRKMAVPSPEGEVKIVSSISTFEQNTYTLDESAFSFNRCH